MSYYRTHTCNELRAEHAEQAIVLSGWLANKRNKGGILFAVLRDHYGSTQLVVDPSQACFVTISEARLESTLRIEGQVLQRPASQINQAMSTGEIEVTVTAVEVLASSDILPFPIVV